MPRSESANRTWTAGGTFADLTNSSTASSASNSTSSVKSLELLWLSVQEPAVSIIRRYPTRTQVARQHYDIGNDLYRIMLDRNMQYTCAYWKDADNLEQAQENKLHLICRKLHLKPGMRVLELGGGFCGLARFMAKEYGCEVVTYNISQEQVKFGREFCAGLPVRIEEKDYREAIHEKGQFDRVAAIGLCEHIGYKNYRPFLELVRAKLKTQRLVPAAHHRRQSLAYLDRSIGRQVHLSQRHGSFRCATGPRHGKPVGSRRLAQLRSRLRQDAAGLVEEL